MKLGITYLILITLSLRVSGQERKDIKFDFNEFNSKDTLQLESYVRDCGEFGGQFEYITIYATDKLTANFKKDAPCNISYIDQKDINEQFEKNKKIDKQFKKQIQLNDELKKLIINYINDFKNFKPDPDMECNAASSSFIIYQKKRYVLIDSDCTWKKFIELRNKLFKND